MIAEDYVPFEIAKLLKEKGFKEWCRCCYGVAVLHNGEDISFDEECDLKDEGRENEIEYVEGGTFYYYNCKNDEEDTNVWAAPTLQMAMKWLRETHNIIIELHHQYRSEWYAIVSSENPLGIGVHTTSAFNSYEQAVEVAIKYCLKNLA